MALWLDPNSESLTVQEQGDLDAIIALKESAAIELKEKGNEYVKMGKKHYKDAVDCYTRAINQKSMDAVNTAILFCNRAHAHLLLGNFRLALLDSQEALNLNSANIKACFRGAKAALSLQLLNDAAQLCTLGLELDPQNKDLLKLKQTIDNNFLEAAERKKQAANAIAKAEVLSSALTSRNIRVGKPAYGENMGGRKPWLDENNILHWPVLLLYGEFMSSDFIEDFCEVDCFSSHLDIIFGDASPSLPWDHKHDYTRGNIQIFYKASAGPSLSRKQVLKYILEGSSSLEGMEADDNEDGLYNSKTDDCNQPWIKVSEKSTLHDVLAKDNYIVPGVPVFYVLSTRSSFYEDFLSGRWSPP